MFLSALRTACVFVLMALAVVYLVVVTFIASVMMNIIKVLKYPLTFVFDEK